MNIDREVLLETFLDCDGAHACLNKEDADDFVKLGEKVTTTKEDCESYKGAWMKKRNEVRGHVDPSKVDLWSIPGVQRTLC